MSDLTLPDIAVDALMPLAIVFDENSEITFAGRSAQRLRPEFTLKGMRLDEVFDMMRPSLSAMSPAALSAHVGKALTLQFRDAPHTKLRAVVQILPDGGGILQLSLGYSIREAVRDYGLTATDFAQCDNAVEMLFLIEANAAAMAESKRLTERLAEARKAAEKEAETDELTGLHNRRALDDALARLTASNTGQPFGLMNLDLDYFKSVNDTYGHAAGDHVLLIVADILRGATRPRDVVARVGGDEFVLLFPDCVDLDVLQKIATRTIQQLERPIKWMDKECLISGSIGITVSTFYDDLDAEEMMADADHALYASKHKGRACATVYDGDGGAAMAS